MELEEEHKASLSDADESLCRLRCQWSLGTLTHRAHMIELGLGEALVQFLSDATWDGTGVRAALDLLHDVALIAREAR
jgi:hypothetical protein